MVLEERPPCLRGWPPPARHQPRNRPLRHVESELHQLPVNTRRAPQRVRSGHLSRQASRVGVDTRTAASRTRPPGPVPREAAAMPGDDRGGSYDHQGRLPVRPGQPKADPEQPVGSTNPRLRTRAIVDTQLLSQRQVLDNETAMSARQDDQEASNLDNAGDHGPAKLAPPCG